MLVLSRHVNEKVIICLRDGTKIAEVIVTELWGNKVRLGFHGEPQVIFHREEVYDAIKDSGQTDFSGFNRKEDDAQSYQADS